MQCLEQVFEDYALTDKYKGDISAAHEGRHKFQEHFVPFCHVQHWAGNRFFLLSYAHRFSDKCIFFSKRENIILHIPAPMAPAAMATATILPASASLYP